MAVTPRGRTLYLSAPQAGHLQQATPVHILGVGGTAGQGADLIPILEALTLMHWGLPSASCDVVLWCPVSRHPRLVLWASCSMPIGLFQPYQLICPPVPQLEKPLQLQ